MQQQVIIWDNHGTIMGITDPNSGVKRDHTANILPNVEQVMCRPHTLNIICSGTEVPHDTRNFDPKKCMEQLTYLMNRLPISMSVFSPAAGGTECWVVIKRGTEKFEVIKAHENAIYAHLIGAFKKPNAGMLEVIKDYVQLEYALDLHNAKPLFVGDSPYDKQAAHAYNIPFVDALDIHTMSTTHSDQYVHSVQYPQQVSER